MKVSLKYLLLIAVTGFIVSVDQASKLYVHSYFTLGQSHPVIPDFFHITYVRNLGAAFGIFREWSAPYRETFFLAMPPLAMLIILLILRSVDAKDRFQAFALSLIFGGALGNYIDRLKFGYVIDFLDFHIKGSSGSRLSWPAFNVADMAIVVGVSILLWLSFRGEAQGAST